MKKANSLIHEDSPYLLQHAYNPVDWLPWNQESLQRAKDEQKPIFVSIGYSSCHWCHVMEHESFEDETIAKILNEHFIAIKIDKEERVDIDKYFQEVYQLLNRRAGGWPLSIFLSHEQKPFYAGTYIPKAKIGKNIAFGELLEIIVDKYKNNRDDIIKNANEIDSFMQKGETKTSIVEFDKSLLSKMISEANFAYDEKFGGFSGAPKFPHSSIIDILIDTYKLTNNQQLLDKVTFTLNQMILGGLYDHVDGGWCRYSVDERWLVPHFEKMGYDNGLLAEVYLKAYLVTKNELFKSVALDSIEFMMEKMSQDNLFFSASDADSKGGEGEYFIYDLKTLHEVFGEDIEILDLPLGGNFEGEFIIRLKDINGFDKLGEYIPQLKSIRATRAYPAIDTKVQTSWSSMVIKSILTASLVDSKYKVIATKYIDALIEKMYIDGELYHSGLVDKTPKIKAYLEDYAYLIDLLLESYRLTQNEHHLILSQQLTSAALSSFFDKGRWYLSVDEFKVEGEVSDNSYPSSIALMTNNLQTLAALGEYKYSIFAKMSIEYYSKKINQNPLYFGLFVKAIYRDLFDERVLKSNNENLSNILLQIGNYSYPYILLQLTQDDTILICGRESCFAQVKTVEEIKL